MATLTASPGLKGKALSLKIGQTEYKQDVLEWELAPEKADDDDLTFAEVAGGAIAAWKLTVTAIQSTDPASFWMFCFDHAGDDATFIVAPHGNDTPTTTQPHFTGGLRISLPPKLSDKAASGKRATFEIEMDVDGALVKTTKPELPGA
ncbi:MAG: hypothetical protein E6261_04600 [Cutibacterium avidum]|nr:hypothetical protein [Cutibacterium avidum]